MVTLEDSPNLNLKRTLAFATVGLGWLLLGLLWIRIGGLGAEFQWPAIRALALFWGLSILDLLAIAKLFGVIYELISVGEEKRPALIFPASYWGAIKLACTGLFITILVYGRGIPAMGILAGLGTLVIVPLGGGLFEFWIDHRFRQRVLQHA